MRIGRERVAHSAKIDRSYETEIVLEVKDIPTVAGGFPGGTHGARKATPLGVVHMLERAKGCRQQVGVYRIAAVVDDHAADPRPAHIVIEGPKRLLEKLKTAIGDHDQRDAS